MGSIPTGPAKKLNNYYKKESSNALFLLFLADYNKNGIFRMFMQKLLETINPQKPKVVRLEPAVQKLVPINMVAEPKFCGHCGALIVDPLLRSWHTTNEHPGKVLADMRFCLICGVECSGSDNRRRHYKVHSPK